MIDLGDYKSEIKKNLFLLKLCRAACPIAQVTGIETYTPHSIVNIIYYLENQQIEWKEDNVYPLYMCNMCGRCDAYCRGMKFVEIIEAARAKASTMGAVPKKVSKLKEKISKEIEASQEALEKFDIIKKGNKSLLILGFNYWKEDGKISKILQIFESLGISVDFLAHEEPYMGENYFDLGFIQEALNYAKEAIELINKYEKVIVIDPATLFTLVKRYSRFNLIVKPKIIHYTSLLSEIKTEKIKCGSTLLDPTAYSDPCELARLNIIKEPRIILKKMGLNVQELQHSGIYTYPVGGCFSFNLIEPETATEITIEKISEIIDLNIRNVITVSNRDKEEMEKVTKKANINLNIYDLIDLLET